MREQITAQAYANAFLSIGESNGVDLAEELTKFNELINQSNDLENLLFLEVFTIEEKKSVLADLFSKIKSNKLLQNFVYYLIEEKRIGLLPVIFKEVIVLDDDKKGFMRGTIEGRTEKLGAAEKKLIEGYLKKKLDRNPTLEYIQTENVTAGYKITVEDLQLDASIDSQFEKFKKSILGD